MGVSLQNVIELCFVNTECGDSVFGPSGETVRDDLLYIWDWINKASWTQDVLIRCRRWMKSIEWLHTLTLIIKASRVLILITFHVKIEINITKMNANHHSIDQKNSCMWRIEYRVCYERSEYSWIRFWVVREIQMIKSEWRIRRFELSTFCGCRRFDNRKLISQRLYTEREIFFKVSFK